MSKKVLIIFIFLLILIGFIGIFSALKYRATHRAPKQPAKAVDIKITFIEGWTVEDIAKYLDSKQIVPYADFVTTEKQFDVSNYRLLSSKDPKVGLEGFLFPDTYLIPQTAPASTSMASIIIKKALDNFSNKFTPEMLRQKDTSGFNIYQIITLASIVERETGRNVITSEQKQALDDQRKIIAGIFYNRLNAGMPLQSDATINYVTGKNNPQPSTEDTQKNSPYNTYLNAGLPPGPIANPSLSSIMAVLYPTKTNYFYFLHKQPSGDPIYSVTYEEHLKNKQKYLK